MVARRLAFIMGLLAMACSKGPTPAAPPDATAAATPAPDAAVPAPDAAAAVPAPDAAAAMPAPATDAATPTPDAAAAVPAPDAAAPARACLSLTSRFEHVRLEGWKLSFDNGAEAVTLDLETGAAEVAPLGEVVEPPQEALARPSDIPEGMAAWAGGDADLALGIAVVFGLVQREPSAWVITTFEPATGKVIASKRLPADQITVEAVRLRGPRVVVVSGTSAGDSPSRVPDRHFTARDLKEVKGLSDGFAVRVPWEGERWAVRSFDGTSLAFDDLVALKRVQQIDLWPTVGYTAAASAGTAMLGAPTKPLLAVLPTGHVLVGQPLVPDLFVVDPFAGRVERSIPLPLCERDPVADQACAPAEPVEIGDGMDEVGNLGAGDTGLPLGADEACARRSLRELDAHVVVSLGGAGDPAVGWVFQSDERAKRLGKATLGTKDFPCASVKQLGPSLLVRTWRCVDGEDPGAPGPAYLVGARTLKRVADVGGEAAFTTDQGKTFGVDLGGGLGAFATEKGQRVVIQRLDNGAVIARGDLAEAGVDALTTNGDGDAVVQRKATFTRVERDGTVGAPRSVPVCP